MATRHAAAPANPASWLMVDVDLSILGQDEIRFQKYEHQIRQEYHWVPKEVFAAKRADILAGFLRRERIFSTEILRTKYESQARHNLEQSIARLRGA